MAALLCEKVKIAAKAQLRPLHKRKNIEAQSLTKSLPFAGAAPETLIALGASTGGVETLREILSVMPANSPPIIITQHMPELFTQSFATRLNSICHLTVKESEDGDILQHGHAYIANGAYHMRIEGKPGKRRIMNDSGDLVSGHRPSVDVMFESLATSQPQQIVAGILTGMGRDGARGLKALRAAGAQTIAEDESSCVVFGMPRVAIELGAAEYVLPLDKIAQELLRLAAR